MCHNNITNQLNEFRNTIIQQKNIQYVCKTMNFDEYGI